MVIPNWRKQFRLLPGEEVRYEGVKAPEILPSKAMKFLNSPFPPPDWEKRTFEPIVTNYRLILADCNFDPLKYAPQVLGYNRFYPIFFKNIAYVLPYKHSEFRTKKFFGEFEELLNEGGVVIAFDDEGKRIFDGRYLLLYGLIQEKGLRKFFHKHSGQDFLEALYEADPSLERRSKLARV
jgi:hypothetical protein